MKKIIFIIYVIFNTFLFFNLNASADEKVDVKVEKSDLHGIILTVTFPIPEIENVKIGKQSFQKIKIGALPTEQRIGYPALPLKTISIGIPFVGKVSYSFTQNKKVKYASMNILPVPTPYRKKTSLVNNRVINSNDIGWHYNKNSEIYGGVNLFPKRLVGKVKYARIRQQRIARFQINPLQYNPVTGELYFSSEIKLFVHYPKTKYRSKIEADDPSFEHIYKRMLINSDVAASFRKSRNIAKNVDNKYFSMPLIQNYKIIIRGRGLYHITGDDFFSYGIDLSSYDPRKFRMFNRGAEIAITVFGGEDGSFDLSDYIEFFALSNDSPYSKDSVYWLQTDGDGAPPMRITERNANPTSPEQPTFFATTSHFEEDNYWGGNIGDFVIENDQWFWDYEYTDETRTFTFDLLNCDVTNSGNATIRVNLQGFSKNDSFAPDHKTEITLNSGSPDTFYWDGEISYTAEFVFPHSYLLQKANQLVIASPEPGSGILNNIYINWIEVDYYDTFVAEGKPFEATVSNNPLEITVSNFNSNLLLSYDIADFSNPVKITHSWVTESKNSYELHFIDEPASTPTYYCLSASMKKVPISITHDIPSKLKSTINSASYLIVTHDDFFPEAVQLAQHRAAQGLVTKVVKISDVYDEFNYGYTDPSALRDFLIYAYNNWSPPLLTYVVFMGDTTFDYLDHLGLGIKSYIPSSYFVTSIMGVTTNDHWFTRLAGDDYLSDIHLGRLAVQTTNQAQAVVDKLIHYDSYSSQSLKWNRNVIFVADNNDSGGCWECFSNEIINDYLPNYLNPIKVFLSNYASGADCKADFISHLNSDTSSAVIVNYFGHGNVVTMASEGIFKDDDVASLTNFERLPFFINMTCYNNYFSFPFAGMEALGEVLSESSKRGAIGMIASTGLTESLNTSALDNNLFDDMYSRTVLQPGVSFTYAKNAMLQGSFCPDEVRNSLLIGDPYCKLKQFTPGVPTISTKGILLLILFFSLIIACSRFYNFLLKNF